MNNHKITIEWEGTLSIDEVIRAKNDGGKAPEWEGLDYGLYQIYGMHQFYGPNTLLYVGIAPKQTFSERFKGHEKDWLKNERDIKLYLGRVYDPTRHLELDKLKLWEWDINIAESIIIYKYAPNYNCEKVSNPPSLDPYEKIWLIHTGERNRLDDQDIAPDHFYWDEA